MESLGSILQGIKERVETNPHREPETPVEPPCPKCNGNGWISLGLRVGEPGFGEAFRCVCRIDLERAATLDNFKPNPAYPDLLKARSAVQDWIDGEGPPILLLAGRRGVGKTHLAEAANLTLELRRLPRRYFTDRSLDLMIRRSFDDDSTDALLHELEKERHLIIDDFGTVARAAAILSLVDDIINLRWERARKTDARTLITTNLAPDELAPRMRSRLQDATRARTVVIAAPDYRLNPWGE